MHHFQLHENHHHGFLHYTKSMQCNADGNENERGNNKNSEFGSVSQQFSIIIPFHSSPKKNCAVKTPMPLHFHKSQPEYSCGQVELTERRRYEKEKKENKLVSETRIIMMII